MTGPVPNDNPRNLCVSGIARSTLIGRIEATTSTCYPNSMIRYLLPCLLLLNACARYDELNATLPPPISAEREEDLGPADPVLRAAFEQAARAEILAEEIAQLEQMAADLQRRSAERPSEARVLEARAEALRRRADTLRRTEL